MSKKRTRKKIGTRRRPLCDTELFRARQARTHQEYAQETTEHLDEGVTISGPLSIIEILYSHGAPLDKDKK